MPVTLGVPTMIHRTILQRLWHGRAITMNSLAPASPKSIATIEKNGWIRRHIKDGIELFAITEAGKETFGAPIKWSHD